jgi:hypothetical protein
LTKKYINIIKISITTSSATTKYFKNITDAYIPITKNKEKTKDPTTMIKTL